MSDIVTAVLRIVDGTPHLNWYRTESGKIHIRMNGHRRIAFALIENKISAPLFYCEAGFHLIGLDSFSVVREPNAKNEQRIRLRSVDEACRLMALLLAQHPARRPE